MPNNTPQGVFFSQINGLLFALLTNYFCPPYLTTFCCPFLPWLPASCLRLSKPSYPPCFSPVIPLPPIASSTPQTCINVLSGRWDSVFLQDCPLYPAFCPRFAYFSLQYTPQGGKQCCPLLVVHVPQYVLHLCRFCLDLYRAAALAYYLLYLLRCIHVCHFQQHLPVLIAALLGLPQKCVHYRPYSLVYQRFRFPLIPLHKHRIAKAL